MSGIHYGRGAGAGGIGLGEKWAEEELCDRQTRGLAPSSSGLADEESNLATCRQVLNE